ncbi:AAA family ATPase [Pyrobaculum sp. 3827-6]|uniref:AAA family ATPase n=1 Tax=Pyrobaculum sp. 3827-6 TaxID=2983604 RepID=UPI0021D87205|nr:AAA family ATPase [Pyrobaculum sp. 3827-6]MCU7787292.1 AAA family ATPase [Pyrobaculum sp. 3827-6]
MIHYLTEEAGLKAFVGVSRVSEAARRVSKEESLRLLSDVNLEYYRRWLDNFGEFYFVPLRGFTEFRRPLKLEEVLRVLGVAHPVLIPQNYLKEVPEQYGRRIIEMGCGGDGEISGGSVELERFVALLMLAGKNVLLVGAPGVGKTELALRAAGFFTSCEPEVEVGREDLSYDDLVVKYVVLEGGRLERRLGSLARAVARSWDSIRQGGGPCHFVFDEINRANVDVALGRIFTALDVEHRARVKVFDGLVDPPYIPLSFRVFATMNVIDRGQLFRLSFALLRRFAYVYMTPPHITPKPQLNKNSLPTSQRDLFRPYAERALRYLAMRGVLEEDLATLVVLGLPGVEELLGEADRLGLLGVLEWALGVADRLGLEVGPSMALDVLRVVAVHAAAPSSLRLSDDVFVDYVVSSLILPYFAAVAPRVRQKAVLSARQPREVNEVRDMREKIGEWLGAQSLSIRVMEGLLHELPVEV